LKPPPAAAQGTIRLLQKSSSLCPLDESCPRSHKVRSAHPTSFPKTGRQSRKVKAAERIPPFVSIHWGAAVKQTNYPAEQLAA